MEICRGKRSASLCGRFTSGEIGASYRRIGGELVGDGECLNFGEEKWDRFWVTIHNTSLGKPTPATQFRRCKISSIAKGQNENAHS